MGVGDHIRRRRRTLGLSLEDVSHASGLSTNCLSELERGLRDPRLSTLMAVAKALGVTPGDLLEQDTTEASPEASRVAMLFDKLSDEGEQEAVVRILESFVGQRDSRSSVAKRRSGRRKKRTA
jgi:transcriptional regulator with XRE-family HTH domain